ncbi:MAG TPA: hypothetical protein VGT41_02155 [Candidatus Babeliales bacterium]|nr:hypothetical protein [Candidatus Babeliales bacterium]
MKYMFILATTTLTIFYGNPLLSANPDENVMGRLAIEQLTTLLGKKPNISAEEAQKALQGGLEFNYDRQKNRKDNQQAKRELDSFLKSNNSPMARQLAAQARLRRKLDSLHQ